ncbi:MAG: 3-oxoacyl-ACP reductase FabG [Candidatus Tectomicrobia bacterium]|nr:3-oxoacyl-ACP reductase FabG [Candidatus Tectomicrobia bacterium]
MGRLDGKRALVTGAARGIGKHYARTLAREGARVALADILDAGPAAEEIRAAGGEAQAFHADVSDEASVEGMVQGVATVLGGVDILVNNAALWADLQFKPFWEQTAAEWDRVLAVNVKGVFLVTRAVFPHMRRQGSGKIINIGSPTAEWGIPGFLQYVTSKGAVHGFTRALAREVGEFGITVNTLAPGFTLSEKVLEMGEFVQLAEQSNRTRRCLKRSQYPEDVQGTLLYLASPASDFMTGQLVVVDGGAVIH